MVEDEWQNSSFTLKFRLGETSLFSFDFPALILQNHFLNSPATTLSSPPFSRLTGATQALLMRSYAVEQSLPRLQFFERAIRYVPSQYRRYYIKLHGSFEDYLKKFSSKSRSTLVRKVGKFSKATADQMEVREYKTPGDMLQFYDDARTISAKTYQERLLDAGLPEGETFKNQLMRLAEQNSVRAYILFHGATPAAYMCCPVSNNTLLYQYVGYDPQFQALSPGSVLQYLTLEKLFAEQRFELFDFTEGEGQHKAFFATDHALCADVYFFKRSLRNTILVMLHAASDSFSSSAVLILDKLGLKARIKKLMRAAA